MRWDVPSVNFLGAVDDGTGKWAKGFWHDSLHPNAAGHDELARTFVPTLFDALEQGKPAAEALDGDRIRASERCQDTVSFTPDRLDASIRVRGDGARGAQGWHRRERLPVSSLIRGDVK